MDYSGRRLLVEFRAQLLLVRQWLHGQPVYGGSSFFGHLQRAAEPASGPRCRWQFCVILLGSCHEEQFLFIVNAKEYFVSLLFVAVCWIILGSCHEEQFLSHRRCQGVLYWIHVHVSLRGVLENFTFAPCSVQCWLRQWIRVLRHLWRFLAIFPLFYVKSGLPILRFMIPLGFIA